LKFDRLVEAIDVAKQADLFAPVTVIVPSPYARVQLRRELGLRRSFCNVLFRTWGEVVADLARLEAGTALRTPSRAILHEALRQVLQDGPRELAAVAATPAGPAPLAELCTELWRAEPSMRAALSTQGPRARALVELAGMLEARLEAASFTHHGRLLDLAAAGTRRSTTAYVGWFLRPCAGREAAVLEGLVSQQLLIETVGCDPGVPTPLDLVVRCADPDEEVRTVLRRVLAAAEAGVELWRQAIVHPPNARYRRIIHQQLAAAGIPAAGRPSLTLAQSAAGRLLTGALRLPRSEWRRESVLRWLASISPVMQNGEPVPVRLWDEVSARAGVVAGLAQWRSRLERFSTIGQIVDPYVAHSAAEVDAARSLSAFVEQLASELCREHRRWSEWTRWAEVFLDRHLAHGAGSRPWPTHQQLATDLVRELLEELGELDAVAAEADLETFCHCLEQELAARPIRGDNPGHLQHDSDLVLDPGTGGLGGPLGRGVFVGTPAEVRGLAFGALHLVGLDDEDLPGSDGEGSRALVPRAVRDGWPARAPAAELLDDLHAAVALAGRTVGTWPAVDPRTGRELVRSRWLDTGQALAPATPEVVIPSFTAGLTTQAGAGPVNGAERQLHALVEEAKAGRSVEAHPVATHDDGQGVPPLRAALASARSAARGDFSRYEGNLGVGIVEPISGEIAPTVLEDYAVCPRRYLLAHLLGIRPPYRPETNEELSAKDRGTLVHEILARYVRERIEQGAPASTGRLLEIARECFDLAVQEGRCGPPLVAELERSRLERELRRFFDEDRLSPVAVELSFGSARRGVEATVNQLPAVEVRTAGGRTVHFGGRMDRIDVAPDGSIVVSDYKTGQHSQLRALRTDPVAQGTKLQLVVYALAARALQVHGGTVRSRYWLVSLNRVAACFELQLNERAVARLSEVVGLIVEGIETGVFPGVPGNETFRANRPTFEHCATCDFDRVCPIDRERRWSLQLANRRVEPVLALGAEPDSDLGSLVRPAELVETA
jgi:ATP-dependent helicase/nuclease subunit B